jgi:RNA polymerase sigma-70 factor (ECF subfamily)
MPLSRQQLVEALGRVAQGDQDAFKAVYAATSLKLYGIVVRILGRRDLAEEVLQDVYIKVWQSAVDYDPVTSSPITWLATIARNRALDEAKRKSMVSLEERPELLQIPGADDPSATYEQTEAARRLYACLDELEPEKKEIVLLVYHYGLTREEIARRINRPVPTVKTWLRRSLEQIKNCLGQ